MNRFWFFDYSKSFEKLEEIYFFIKYFYCRCRRLFGTWEDVDIFVNGKYPKCKFRLFVHIYNNFVISASLLMIDVVEMLNLLNLMI